MASLLHFFFCILVLHLGVSRAIASSPAEHHWKRVLPNAPMPNAISDLLHPGRFRPQRGHDFPLEYSHYGIATEAQLRDAAVVTAFFLEKDLYPGAKLTTQLTRSVPAGVGHLLPRSVADSIPFSSADFPEILIRFSVDPESGRAEKMRKTISECEAPPAAGETKLCATSLESMVDFAVSALTTNDVRALSTTVNKEDTPLQQYTINSIRKIALTSKAAVSCHNKPYAYVVFHCHSGIGMEPYAVSLLGDGDDDDLDEGGQVSKAEAVVVCHTNTSGWNPQHLAFQVLKVNPGTVPICHLLPRDHILWITI